MDALSIPSILNTVLQNFDTAFIAKCCRLVNSQWNHESCNVLKNRKTINFTSWKEIKRFHETFNNSSCEKDVSIKFHSFHFSSDLFVSAIQESAFGELKRLQEAITLFTKVSGKEVVQLEISLYPVYPDTPVSHSTVLMYKELLRMIYVYFPNIKVLKVLFLMAPIALPQDFDVQYYIEQFEGKELPNLENVSIEVSTPLNLHDVQSFEFQNMIPSFVKCLLFSATHLQYLSSSSRKMGRGELNDCVIKFFPIFSNYLRKLDILLTLQEHDLVDLCRENLKSLRHLRLELDTESVTESSLKACLAYFRHSLRSLHLGFSDSSQSVKLCLQFPMNVVMHSLQSMTLEKYAGSLEWENLPSLKSLTVKECQLNRILTSLVTPAQLCDHDGKSNPSATQKIDSELKSERLIDKLVIWEVIKINSDSDLFLNTIPKFSTLTTLHISSLPNLSLTKLFEHCKKLKDLCIMNCAGVTDEIVCGIRGSLLKTICPLGMLVKESSSKDHDHDICLAMNGLVAEWKSQLCLRETPFIGDLTDLQILEIEGKLSDTAILFGIIHCSQLKTVALHSNFLTWRSSILLKTALKDLTRLQIQEIITATNINSMGPKENGK